jgi:peptide chain release factor 1
VKPSIQERLRQVAGRYEEVGLLLSEQDVLADQNRYRQLAMEYAQLQPLAVAWRKWTQAQASMDEARQMLREADLERAAAERSPAQRGGTRVAGVSISCCCPRDHDDNNIFLEVRADWRRRGGDSPRPVPHVPEVRREPRRGD